jgi:transposase-like protein
MRLGYQGPSLQQSRQHPVMPARRFGCTQQLYVVRSIFEQSHSESVWAQHARVMEALQAKYLAAAQLLAEAAEDVLVFTHFPKEHWRQIRSNNPQERA